MDVHRRRLPEVWEKLVGAVAAKQEQTDDTQGNADERDDEDDNPAHRSPVVYTTGGDECFG
jgi:hypothetical protein